MNREERIKKIEIMSTEDNTGNSFFEDLADYIDTYAKDCVKASIEKTKVYMDKYSTESETEWEGIKMCFTDEMDDVFECMLKELEGSK